MRDLGDEVEPVAVVPAGEATADGVDAGGEVGQALTGAGLGLLAGAVVADVKPQQAVGGGGRDRALRGRTVPEDVGDGLPQHGRQHGVGRGRHRLAGHVQSDTSG
jgi:hypothetical protein